MGDVDASNNYNEDVISGGSLKEQTCNAAPLPVNIANYNQEGLVLTCTDGDVGYNTDNELVIPAENHCMLLCDMYFIRTIFVDWKEYGPDDGLKKGERVWYYQNNNGDPRHEIELVDTDSSNHVDSIIRCWADK